MGPRSELLGIAREKRLLAYIISSLALLLLGTLGMLSFPALTARIVDVFFIEGEMEKGYFLVLIVISIVTVGISYLQTFMTSLVSERFAFLARNRLYEKIISQPERYFIEHDKSKVLTVIMSDVNMVKLIVSQFLPMGLISMVMIVGSAVLMLFLDWVLAGVIIVIVPAAMVSLTLFMRNVRDLFSQVQSERDNFNRTIDENVKASMLIRVFNSEGQEIEKFAGTNRRTFELQKRIIRKFSVMIPGVYMVMFVSTLIITLLGGWYVIGGRMTLGEISAFSTYMTMFTLPMMMLGMISNMIGQAFASLDRIGSLLAYEDDTANGSSSVSAIDSISAKKLDLTIEGKEILRDMDLEVSKGEKIGIIGLTGSGKSMLIQVLLRLIEPTGGKVLLNGSDINDFAIETVRSRIGVVFQDNYLFDDTIDKNIDFKRGLSKKDIRTARRLAEVDEFYKGRSGRRIGELGKKLSGGQKQRLRIARAIAGKPDLLILDDSTSDLDVKTERKIISNIRESLMGISIIIISQKISSLSDCDRIYVLEGGRIVQAGTHEELLGSSILYKEIEMTQKNRGA